MLCLDYLFRRTIGLNDIRDFFYRTIRQNRLCLGGLRSLRIKRSRRGCSRTVRIGYVVSVF